VGVDMQEVIEQWKEIIRTLITLGFSLGNSRRLMGYILNPRLKPGAINKVEFITLGFSLGNSRRQKRYILNPRLKPVEPQTKLWGYKKARLHNPRL